MYSVRNMPKVFTSKNQKSGEVGESIAVKYLESKGYAVLERNYTKRCGEIDIEAQKEGKVYFIEVKSRSVRTFHENAGHGVNPAENMHYRKLLRFRRVVAEYLFERKIGTSWQVGVILICMNTRTRIARIQYLENVIL